MSKYFSLRQETENKRNIRKIYLFSFLSIVFIFIFFKLGIPLAVKYIGFISKFKNSTAVVEIEDKTPPPPPSLDPIPEFTNKKDVDISGSTEAGITVFIFVNNEKFEILSNSDGKFSYNIYLDSTENTIEAQSKDNSGNTSKKILIGDIIFDNKPPDLTIIKPKDGEEFTGSLKRQLTLEGNTEPESKVTINSRHVIVDENGAFSYSITLNEGENNFNIKSEDKSGNITEKSIKVFFYY